MKYGAQSLVRKKERGRSASQPRAAPKRAMTQNSFNEKRVSIFSELGWKLSAARTQRDAAAIIMDAADELFGWDACTFDVYSPEQRTVSTVLYMDTIDGKRVDVSPECVGTKPTPQMIEVIESGAKVILRPTAKFDAGATA